MNISITIDKLSELMKDIEDYKFRYPDTYTSLDYIEKIIGSVYNRQGVCDEYQIPVCSDWEDKVYCFETKESVETDSFVLIQLAFTGIIKA